METPTPHDQISDAQVFQNLMNSLQECLRLDRIICEMSNTDQAGADRAAARFDHYVDLALVAHSDLVTRGLPEAIAEFLGKRAPVWEGAA